MTTYECPLCKIRMDVDYDYQIKYLWCDDCRMKVTRYLEENLPLLKKNDSNS